MARRQGMPLADLLRLTFTRVVPVGLAVGAAMEVFMYATGFWSVALRREAERREERRSVLDALSAPGGGSAGLRDVAAGGDGASAGLPSDGHSRSRSGAT